MISFFNLTGTHAMHDFYEDEDDGPGMGRCALGAVVCLAVLAGLLAGVLLLG